MSGWLPRKRWFRSTPNPATAHMADLCRWIAFHRDDFTCWDCGVERREMRLRKVDGMPWYPGLQAAHIIGKGRRPSMKFELENIATSCTECHSKWHDPRLYEAKLERFKALYPERYALLEAMARDKKRKKRLPADIREELAHEYNRIRPREVMA